MNQNHTYSILPETNLISLIFLFASAFCFKLSGTMSTFLWLFLGLSFIFFLLFIFLFFFYKKGTEKFQVSQDSVTIFNKKKQTFQKIPFTDIESILVGHYTSGGFFTPPSARITLLLQNTKFSYWFKSPHIIAIQESLKFFGHEGIQNFEQSQKILDQERKMNSFEKNFVFIFGSIMFCLVLLLAYWAGTQIK